MHMAALAGAITTLQTLLEYKSDQLLLRDGQGMLPLHCAAVAG